MNIKRRGLGFKQEIYDLLKAEDFSRSLDTFHTFPARQVISPLFSFLCHMDEAIRWKSIAAMGAVVAKLAENDMESARVVMRRMMWQLSDESGGIGWGVPEAMGEIMARHEGLAREYSFILVSYVRKEGNFLEHEPLRRGVLWGLGRLAQVRPCLIREAVPHLQEHLTATDPTLRGLAAWAIGMTGPGTARRSLEALVEDDTEVKLYLKLRPSTYRVGDLAREALTQEASSPSG